MDSLGGGTAMERLHRLIVSAHEHCVELSLREWQGLELFYSQWNEITADAREAAKRCAAEGDAAGRARAEDSAVVAREQMDGMKQDFRRVPEWVWRLRSFQALAEDDPAKFADVRSVLGRGRSDDGSSMSREPAADEAMLATEVWLAHIGALQRGTRTPRVGIGTP